VEVNDSAFIEGAWSGAYSEMRFTDACTFTGTGGFLTPHGLLLATPTHSSECLYTIRVGTNVICSNCLAFLLTTANDDIDRSYQYYDIDIMSIGLGIKRYSRSIPTASHNTVHLYYYCNILVSPDLSVTVLPKNRPGSFYTYPEYQGWLQREMLATTQNAANPQRAVTYTPITTISTGYDSTAAAVLARTAGCREALTFAMAHDPSRMDVCDSGKQIGSILGLAVTEYDPTAYLAREDSPEAEFLATGASGGDVVLTVLEDRLASRLLFTGYHGDPAWDRTHNTGGPDMIRLDPAPGSDMIYFRTRVGFIHLPVPSIGYIEHDSILALSSSVEMQPWSLRRDDYDRPIPRRIVEEAGVPREMFGQRKKIAVRPHKCSELYAMPEEPDLRGVMAPGSYDQFRSWAQTRPPFRSWSEHVFFFCLHTMYRLNMRMLHSRRIRGIAKRLGVGLPQVPWVPSKYGKRRTVHRLLFHWGMERMMTRYSARPTR
jgi:hypothetical protein